MKEGFSVKTLSVLNDRQLSSLYQKMVTETNVVINDPDQLKDVKKDIDPDKDSIEIKGEDQQEKEQEMSEIFKKKKKKSNPDAKIIGGGQPPRNTPDAQKRGLEVEKKKKEETKEGWDTKNVTQKHKMVKSSFNKFKAAQTAKYTDHWMSDEDRKKEREAKKKANDKVYESNIGKFHKPVFKNEKELAEKLGCTCGKCDICKNKDKTKKKGTGLSENNFLSLAKKKDIMEMIRIKLGEQVAAPTTAPTKPQTRPETKPHTAPIKPKTPFRPQPGSNPKPKAGVEGLPDFMTFDKIFGKHKEFQDSADPAIAPTKPTTKPTTRPDIKPSKPKTPFRPQPGSNPKPKAGIRNEKK
jgi:hypothetical protein